MRARTAAAAATRAAILKAAHRLLNRPGGTALTLHEVAAEAGVSRATVYKSVGPRQQLLAAVFEDQGRLIAFDRVLTAMAIADPRTAVIATVRESCRAWSVMPNAIRKTLALAALDVEIDELVRAYERSRRVRLTSLARRWCSARGRRASADVRAAAATLALLTSFTAFDLLRAEHDVRRSTDLLVRMAKTALDVPPR